MRDKNIPIKEVGNGKKSRRYKQKKLFAAVGKGWTGRFDGTCGIGRFCFSTKQQCRTENNEFRYMVWH